MITRTHQAVHTAFVDGIYKRAKNDVYFQSIILLIFVWGFLDTASTYVAISAYGTVEYEWNPFTRMLLEIDLYMLTVGKGVGVLAIGLIGVYGRPHIVAVPGWKIYFRALILFGVLIAVVNLYAAYTAATGHDPVFSFIESVL